MKFIESDNIKIMNAFFQERDLSVDFQESKCTNTNINRVHSIQRKPPLKTVIIIKVHVGSDGGMRTVLIFRAETKLVFKKKICSDNIRKQNLFSNGKNIHFRLLGGCLM